MRRACCAACPRWSIASRASARDVARALEGRSYDLGIVEHSWAAPYFEQVAPHCRRTVLDLHNVESVLHDRCAQTEPGAQAFAHRVFRDASRELERTWFPRFSQVLATVAEDAQQARAIAPGVRRSQSTRTHCPPSLSRRTWTRRPWSSPATWNTIPNITAVRFFREQVWPQLRDRWPTLVWRLVGKNPAAVRRYTAGDPRIEVVGPVDDAVAELARSRVAVVPLLSGSGTRLKILEAWAAGLPVVSTTTRRGRAAGHGWAEPSTGGWGAGLRGGGNTAADVLGTEVQPRAGWQVVAG